MAEDSKHLRRLPAQPVYVDTINGNAPFPITGPLYEGIDGRVVMGFDSINGPTWIPVTLASPRSCSTRR